VLEVMKILPRSPRANAYAGAEGSAFRFVLVTMLRGQCPWLSVRSGGWESAGHRHIADSVAAVILTWWYLRRSEAVWRCRRERSVKPSAQPTLVRTQHLPHPGETAPGLRKRGPVGRFLLVTPCIRVCHRRSMRSSGYGHMADSVQAERAVRITAPSHCQ
jgi:hypothetical protein